MRRAEVAQALLADLLQAPHGRIDRLVVVVDVGVAGPVVEAGIGHAAAQRIAMAADVFGDGVDDQ
jgi:hypothetical protein